MSKLPKGFWRSSVKEQAEMREIIWNLPKEVREEYLKLKYTSYFWFFNSISTYLKACEYIGTHRCTTGLDFIIEHPFRWERIQIEPEQGRALFSFSSSCYAPPIIHNTAELEEFKSFRKAQINEFTEKFIENSPNNYLCSVSGVENEKFIEFMNLLEENGKLFERGGFIAVVRYSYEQGYIKMDSLSKNSRDCINQILNY